MKKKIFFSLLPLFIFLVFGLSFAKPAFALSCDIKAEYEWTTARTTQTFTIKSQKTDGSSNFVAGQNLKLDIRGKACGISGNQALCIKDLPITLDASLNPEKLNNVDLKRKLREGTLRVIVKDDGGEVCTSQNFTVNQINNGEQCTIGINHDAQGRIFLIASNINPNANKSFDVEVRRYKNDTENGETGNPLPKAVPIDLYNTVPSREGNYCVWKNELEHPDQYPQALGYPIGNLSTGLYYFEIKDGCGSLGNGTLCTLRNIQVDSTQGATVDAKVCYYCPSGSHYVESTDGKNPPVCINNSTGQVVKIENDPNCTETVCKANCGGTNYCNHLLGCEITDQKKSENLPTPTPPCSELNEDGTCKAITSGLGISLPTKASDFITALLGAVLSISGGIAVLLIIVSGYRLMVSQGNPEKIQAAKEELTAAIVGFLFIIFSLVILQVIGFDILHLPGFGA